MLPISSVGIWVFPRSRCGGCVLLLTTMLNTFGTCHDFFFSGLNARTQPPSMSCKYCTRGSRRQPAASRRCLALRYRLARASMPHATSHLRHQSQRQPSMSCCRPNQVVGIHIRGFSSSPPAPNTFLLLTGWLGPGLVIPN
ncbi:hypothetical protein IWZ00DRAFT_494866 [Phyllosticta capitalensis]